MALTHAEPRLAPLGNTFQVWGEEPRARKRSHSYSGYAPHRLQLSLDDPGEGRGGGRRVSMLGEAACTSATASEDGSTSAPGSGASEAPSSPREHDERAGGLDEESSPELWPDTDSNDEEYDWSPCSRRRAVVHIAGAEAGARVEGTSCQAPPQVLATTPAGGNTCSPAVAAALCAPAMPVATMPSLGHAGQVPPSVAAPPGAVGLPLAQAQMWAPAPTMVPVLLPVASMAPQGPRWLGGPFPPAARGVRADTATASPHGVSSLESAMRAAESALAALEAAEAEAAEEGPDCARDFTPHEATAEFHQAWHGLPTSADRPAGRSGVDISGAWLQGLGAGAGTRARSRARTTSSSPWAAAPAAALAAGSP